VKFLTRDPAKALGRDTHDREYVLTSCPVVAADQVVLLVDLSVHLSVRADWPFGYDPAEEPAIHAVVVMMLRMLAEETASAELLVGRARVVESVEKALAFAPVASGLDRRVTTVEVRPHDPSGPRMNSDFRVVRP
jgi:hypothetical protein